MPSRFEYERAVRSSDLPSLSRLLALTVATWADVKTGVIPDRLQPSLTTLEEATGMVRGSVRKHLDTLEAGGWLKRDRPSVAAARSKKARTKYAIKIPRGAAVSDTDGIELGRDVPGARAGDALDEPGLGQQAPQVGAGDALALGQEMTTTRAPDALSSSYGPKTSVEYQLHPAPVVATPAPEDDYFSATAALDEGADLFDSLAAKTEEIHKQRHGLDLTGFLAFWTEYPKKRDREEAVKEYRAAIARGADRDRITAGAKAYAAERKGQQAQYTKLPATWLRKGCYDDEPDPQPGPHLRAVPGGWTGPNRPHPMTGAAAQIWTADDYKNAKPF